MATPGMPFNQMIGTPVELTLRRSGADGLRLDAYPIKELAALRTKSAKLKAQSLEPGQNPLRNVKGELLDIEAELTLGSAAELAFKLRGVPLSYNIQKAELTCAGQTGQLHPVDGKLRLRFLVDRTSIDIFGNLGELYMSAGVIPLPEEHSLELQVQGNGARIDSLTVWELMSIWR
jgi:sucrose-6-phosphate hydrolase SacC (GH32 family)